MITADLHVDTLLRKKAFKQNPLDNLSKRRAPGSLLLEHLGRQLNKTSGKLAALNFQAQTDFPRLVQAQYGIGLMGIHSFTNYGSPQNAFNEMQQEIAYLDHLCASSGGLVVRARSFKELITPPEHAITVMPGIEGAHMLMGPQDVGAVKNLGVGYITLCHMLNNWAATGSYAPGFALVLFASTKQKKEMAERANDGLTSKGVELVKEMIKHRLPIDVAHMNSPGLQHACHLMNTYAPDLPILCSHTSYRAAKNAILPKNNKIYAADFQNGFQYDFSGDLFDKDYGNNPHYIKAVPNKHGDPAFRGISRADVEAIVRTGKNSGLIGILFAPMYLSKDKSSSRIIAEHIHALRTDIDQLGLTGFKHVAIGSDYDGCIDLPKDQQSCLDMHRIYDELKTHFNWNDIEINALASENVINFFTKWK